MGKKQLEEKEHQLLGRLHRLEGQVRAMERTLAKGDPLMTVTQFEAIIAAAKSCLTLYVETTLGDETIEAKTRTTIIGRIIQRS